MKKSLSLAIIAFFIFFSTASNLVFAQSGTSVTSNGAFLDKFVSNTTVQTGVNISYTIAFSIPAGSTNIVISDQLPSSLELVSIVYSPVCGTPVVTPNPVVSGTMGALVKYQLTSVPTACSGTFQIIAKFPAGTTCDGTVALNKACMTGIVNGKDINMCTKEIRTTAIAANPWTVKINPIGTFYNGSTSCAYTTPSDTVTYEVRVAKTPGIYGFVNLVNGVVSTPFTGGTILNITTPTGGTPTSGTASGVGTSTLTWNTLNLVATQVYNAATVQVKVYYPGMVPSTNYPTTATLTGSLGTALAPCQATVNTTSNTCVIKNPPPTSTGSFYKTVSVGGHSVGCTGYYDVYVYNTGSVGLPTFTFNDILPTGVTATSIAILNASAAAPVTLNVNGTNVLTGVTNTTTTYSTLPINSVGVTQTGTLAVGQLTRIRIYFTINSSAPSIVSNTATVVTPTTITPTTRTVTFGVYTPAPEACVYKFICNPKPNNIYNQGDIIRYRLRVQNIGTATMSGTTISDILDAGLQYVGNPSYYSSTSNNPACVAPNTNTWTTPSSPVFSQTGNTVSWSIPDIGSNCQSVLWTNCGYWGTSSIPFYFIEFDVKVTNTAALGPILNKFSIGGGNLPTTVTSQNAYITIAGTHGFGVTKQVSTNGGTTYSNTGIIASGGAVNYRLKMQNTGTVSFNNVLMIDLLPRNNGTNDNFILNRPLSRGSQFDVNYTGFVASTPFVPSLTRFDNGTNLCIPEMSYSPSLPLCNAPTWSILAAPSKNAKMDFGATNYLSAGNSLTYDFKATAAAAAANQIACNTFAANATGSYITNNNVITSYPLPGAESGTACVTVQQACTFSIAGNTKVCKGSPTTLTANASVACSTGYTYLWSNGATTQSITVSPSATTTYTCTITCSAQGGCSGVASTTVNVLPSPSISLVGISIKCEGTTSIVSIDISVTGGTPNYTYLWNNGATTEDIINATNGLDPYCVTVTDKNGCTAVKCFDCTNPCKPNGLKPVIETNNGNANIQTSNIEKNNDGTDLFKVYPNPFESEINIEWTSNNNTKKIYTINMFNAMGQLIKTQTVDNVSKSSKFDTSSIPVGLYNVIIESEGKVVSTTKIVKD